MRLVRAHGLGNDYLVLEEGPPLDPHWVRVLCDRHRGVGGDGMLEPRAAERGDHGVRIWNPDGSIAGMSGNGVRIFARWLADRGAGESFTVWTGRRAVACHLRGDEVEVALGVAAVGQPAVQRVWAGGRQHVGVVVDVGNPHFALFTDEPELDALPWRAWGRALERHPHFPEGTNVQLAHVVGPTRLALRIWERGAGETRASGSSSCAVAVAAVVTERVAPGPLRLEMPGGELRVTVGPRREVTLAGAVEVVGRIELDPRWLRARGL